MTMTPEDLEELREAFEYNDVDQDGRIQFAEFLEMLDQLDAGVRSPEARIGFDSIDINKDGSINFDEFVAWWRER